MSANYNIEKSPLGAQVLAVVWSVTSVSGFVLIVHLIFQFKFLQKPKERLTIVFIGITVFTHLEVQLGFGYHVYEIPTENLAILGFYGQLTAFFSILGALWSKTSFALTMLRLTSGNISFNWIRVTIWSIIITMNVFMLLSGLLTWIQCTPVNKIWDRTAPGTCWDADVVPAYDTFSGVWSGIMDLCLAALPWPILVSLQMTTKEKYGVGIAMSMGIFAGATGFIKSSYLMRLASGDFTYDGAPLVIWGSAETAITIVATSIPVLRVLLAQLKHPASRRDGSTWKSMPENTKNSGIKTNFSGIRARLDSTDDINETASDTSILQRGPRIVKTSNVTTEYTSNMRDAKGRYEMDNLSHSGYRGGL
ncbi:hypothetical protein BX600DRAFT_442966 [Xylariales sp. PMI_506]|nr:hypothetical protein BX600DRAFT_442966 [Xylariales sp. PMI_506]